MQRRRGFTLVEIMIVVAIIGLLAAIAIPAFIKARNSARRNACINNLRQMDGAKDEYALEYGGTAGMGFAWADIGLYVKDITNKLYCPAARGTNRFFSLTYTIGALGVNPACTVTPGTTDDPDHDLTFKAR